jgi:hypothetical protein
MKATVVCSILFVDSATILNLTTLSIMTLKIKYYASGLMPFILTYVIGLLSVIMTIVVALN